VGEHDDGWLATGEGERRKGEEAVGDDDVGIPAGSMKNRRSSQGAQSEKADGDRQRASGKLQLRDPHPANTEVVELRAQGTIGGGAAH
jgi:hypothetical protein